MPVTSCHPQFSSASCRWKKIRDCIEGSDAVKEAGTEYLPALGSHASEPTAYETYKMRANFVNATNRTHDALMGFLFRKEPKVDFGTANVGKPEQANIDLAGNTILDYARIVGDDVASIGRAGTLIDWTDAEGVGRPRFAYYTAENIINWRARFVGGRCLVTMLVLRELIELEGSDEFECPEQVQYRVLTLTEEGVWVRIFQGGKETTDIEVQGGGTKEGFLIENLGIMSRRGRPVMEIPFVFHNADHIGPSIGISPLYDLACINISHYQSSADCENARHALGSPTPYAFGLTSGGQPVDPAVIYLGGPAWLSDNHDAKAGFVEFTGTGLGELKDALSEKIAMMAAIGARMIEPKKGDTEAYETVALRATAETSALSNMAIFISRSMTDCLKWFVWWMGTQENVSDVEDVVFEINRDFADAKLTSQDLTALTNSYLNGTISFETLFHNLHRADMYPPERTMEEERAAIDEQLAMPTPGAIGESFKSEEERKKAELAQKQGDDQKPPAKKAAKKSAGKAPPTE